MMLRTKILTIVGLTLACLIALLYGSSQLVLRRSFVDLEAQSSVTYLLLSLVIVGVVFGGVTLWLLQRVILSRLDRLGRDVQRVSSSRDPTARVEVTGRDELAGLAEAINGMLEALERSQAAIRASEERLRTVVQNMPAMMVAFDQEGRIMVWNQECERVTGYSADEIIGNPQAVEWLWPDPAYRARMSAEWFSRGYDYRDWEWRITCKDGNVRTVAWANISEQFPIPGWESWSIGVDVTERVRAQAELEQRLTEQETLFFIGRLISSSLEVERVMQLVAEHMAHLVGAVCCVISDWDPETGALTVRARYTHPEQGAPEHAGVQVGHTYALAERPTAQAALCDRAPFVAYAADPTLQEAERQRLQARGWSGLVGMPIVVLDEVIGLVEVYLAGGERTFTEHDMRLMQSLVDQVAVAIHNARLFSVVQANQAALRDLSLRLINAQEQERRLVAQELHDELGQLLTALKINVDLARRRLPEGTEVLARRLEEASALTDKVLANVRTMTVELRPTLLDDMGIVPTLRWHVKRFAARTGIDVELDVPDLAHRLRPEVETTLYRVAQEALTNVARHAQAGRVEVRLTHEGDTVTLTVVDDGKGFDVSGWNERQQEQPSLGLSGIRERVMLLDGKATIASQPGAGTRIEVVLPARYVTEGVTC